MIHRSRTPPKNEIEKTEVGNKLKVREDPETASSVVAVEGVYFGLYILLNGKIEGLPKADLCECWLLSLEECWTALRSCLYRHSLTWLSK